MLSFVFSDRILRITLEAHCSSITGMENAKAKEMKNATVTNRSDGEGCNGAREERSGEVNYTLSVRTEQNHQL